MPSFGIGGSYLGQYELQIRIIYKIILKSVSVYCILILPNGGYAHRTQTAGTADIT